MEFQSSGHGKGFTFNGQKKLPIACLGSETMITIRMVIVFLDSFLEITLTNPGVKTVKFWAVQDVAKIHIDAYQTKKASL